MVKIINIDTKTKTIHISNADGDIKTWRTTESGTHFPIREGESTKEALDKFVGSKRPEAKKEKQQPADTPKPGITWNLTEKQKKEFKDLYEKQDKTRTKEDDQIDDLCYNYGVDDEKDLMKAIEDHYVNQVAFYGKDSRDAEQAMRDYKKAGRLLGQEPKSHDEIMQGRTIEFEPDLPAKEPAKSEPASKPMSADHVKQTMQKTMESFPKLYSWEKPHLEKFADDIWSELEKNPGKEQEILDEWVEAYDGAAKRLGMWVDTPTLVKRDFVKKVAESWKNNSGTQGQQPEKTASAPEKSESTGDVSGSYPELGGVQQALWDAGYIMDNYDDGEFGDTGTEYVWKDGTMYAVDITKNPDGSVSAKQSSMGEVSQSEYAKYLDEIHGDDDEDEDEDDETDSDISGIESRGEAANWLNAMTRKHGNTYFWSGNMKSALNKLVEKFGNTYFWNK